MPYEFNIPYNKIDNGHEANMQTLFKCMTDLDMFPKEELPLDSKKEFIVKAQISTKTKHAVDVVVDIIDPIF